jgi:hypothetical protein
MDLDDIGYGLESFPAWLAQTEALALESGMKYPLRIAWQSASGVGRSLVVVSVKKMVGDINCLWCNGPFPSLCSIER